MENDTNLPTDPRDQKRYYFHETRTRKATVAMLSAFAFFVMKIEQVEVMNCPIPQNLMANEEYTISMTIIHLHAIVNSTRHRGV